MLGEVIVARNRGRYACSSSRRLPGRRYLPGVARVRKLDVSLRVRFALNIASMLIAGLIYYQYIHRTLMKASFLLCSLIALLPLCGNAQCGFDDIYHRSMQTDAAFSKAMIALRQEYNGYREALKNSKQSISGTDTVITIPLVLHIVHNGEPVGTRWNLSDSQLRAWIRSTDGAFNASFPGTKGSPTGIRFVLAQTDQNRQPTTGIVRVDGSGVPSYTLHGIQYPGVAGPGAANAAIRNLGHWNCSEYFNVWVVGRIVGIYTGYSRGALDFPAANSVGSRSDSSPV